MAKSAAVGRAALSDTIQPGIDEMIGLVALESFEPKHRFPEPLKAPLHELSLKALETGDFGDNFVHAMAAIFPYNTFTMRKFIIRDVYPDRVADAEARKEAAITKFEGMIDEAMPAAQAAYDQSLEKYEREREAWDAAHPAGGDDAAPAVPPTPSAADASMDVDAADTSMADVSTAVAPAAGKARA